MILILMTAGAWTAKGCISDFVRRIAIKSAHIITCYILWWNIWYWRAVSIWQAICVSLCSTCNHFIKYHCTALLPAFLLFFQKSWLVTFFGVWSWANKLFWLGSQYNMIVLRASHPSVKACISVACAYMKLLMLRMLSKLWFLVCLMLIALRFLNNRHVVLDKVMYSYTRFGITFYWFHTSTQHTLSWTLAIDISFSFLYI